ncbi:MAG: hypothetical protein Fur002_14370 [Anaerolineales bacterium]
MKITLLDIDSVLVQPHGYRAALRATIHRFIPAFVEIPESLILEIEKRGISSEWDMAALLIASYWNEVLTQRPQKNLPAEISLAAEMIQRAAPSYPLPLGIPQFDLAPGEFASQTALRLGLFPALPLEIKQNLLAFTRQVARSETTRALQHFTLGSARFEQTYQLPAEFETESYLLKYDLPNLDEDVRAVLRRDNARLSILTARPSSPPREVKESLPGYAPEAELALELVNMSDLPLMGYGKLQYIAERRNLDPAALIKPSAFHALAGALSAWTGEELPALEAAAQWLASGTLPAAFNALPKAFELLVVEDTLGGVRSARAAGEVLNRHGFQVSVCPLGLTSGSRAKAAAFDAAGVPHEEDWRALCKFFLR